MKTYSREIPFDQGAPMTAFSALREEGACLLEFSQMAFVGVDPIASISGKGDYVPALREFQKKYPVAVDHPLALYTGGPIGYVTYEGDYFFQIYQSTVVFDHQKERAVLFTLQEEELGRLEKKIQEGGAESSLEIGPVVVDTSDAEYVAMVERAKEHLRAGDVFQIVLSRTFQARVKGDPLQFYRILREVSPAPYLFFFQFKDFAIAGASPEKIISVQDRVIESMPIAGTRPKGCLAELLNDPKESAEHVMLVDLARNDVGAVSVPGSVKVAEFKTVHAFSHVDHIVSRVTGVLDGNYDALDAFKASFPAGTLTGAPKIRAMELIEEIRCARNAFATSLESSADHRFVVMIRARGTQWA
jgi:anthranilate synthase component 1